MRQRAQRAHLALQGFWLELKYEPDSPGMTGKTWVTPLNVYPCGSNYNLKAMSSCRRKTQAHCSGSLCCNLSPGLSKRMFSLARKDSVASWVSSSKNETTGWVSPPQQTRLGHFGAEGPRQAVVEAGARVVGRRVGHGRRVDVGRQDHVVQVR